MKRSLLFIFLISVFLALPFVYADVGDFGSSHMGTIMYGTYGPGVMLFSWLFGLLVLIALVLLIIWLIKQIQKK